MYMACGSHSAAHTQKRLLRVLRGAKCDSRGVCIICSDSFENRLVEKNVADTA